MKVSKKVFAIYDKQPKMGHFELVKQTLMCSVFLYLFIVCWN